MSKVVTLMFLFSEFWRSESVETADRAADAHHSPGQHTGHPTLATAWRWLTNHLETPGSCLTLRSHIGVPSSEVSWMRR